MPISAARAVQLLKELYDLDRSTKGQPPLLVRQRRQVIARELHSWAMANSMGHAPAGATRREHPRAAVELSVRLLGGPHPIDLVAESLAVGGLAARIRSFTPRVGDLWALRLATGEREGAGPPTLDVMGKVVWVDVGRARAGVRFVDVNDDAREVLERVVFRSLVERGPA